MSMLKNDVMTEIDKRNNVKVCDQNGPDCTGWNLYHCYGCPSMNDYQIERCDGCEKFKDDLDAELFVINEIVEMSKKLLELEESGEAKYKNAGVLICTIHKKLKQTLEGEMINYHESFEAYRKEV